MTDWIPASEPPDDERIVWVWTTIVEQGFYVGGFWRVIGYRGPADNVTYWQNLSKPEPPEDSNG